MILHGKYKKGIITINEKELPQIESDVEIYLLEKPPEKKSSQFLSLAGIWKDRPEMADSVKWVQSQRVKEETRYRGKDDHS